MKRGFEGSEYGFGKMRLQVAKPLIERLNKSKSRRMMTLTDGTRHDIKALEGEVTVALGDLKIEHIGWISRYRVIEFMVIDTKRRLAAFSVADPSDYGLTYLAHQIR